MRLSLWQQFSSNHSSSFRVVGVFEDAVTAQKAADEVQIILARINQWHIDHPEESQSLFEDGDWPPTPSPIEVEIGKQYGFDWEGGIDWGSHAHVNIVMDKFIYISHEWQVDFAGEPFKHVIDALGGKGLMDGSSVGDDLLGTILIDLTCTAPNEIIVEEIYGRYLSFQTRIHRGGTHLHFDRWTFSESPDLTLLLSDLEKRGCTDIQYSLRELAPGEKFFNENDIEVLIDILEKCHNSSDQSEAARELGNFRDPRAVIPLINALKHADDWVRRDAASSLGQIGDPQAVLPLIELLNDQDSWTRQTVIRALENIGNEAALDGLVLALRDRDELTWQAAAKALEKFGEKAREALQKVAQDDDSMAHERIQEALRLLDDTQAGGELLARMRSADAKTRIQAFEEAKSKADVETLIAYLRNFTDPYLADRVVEALGEIGDVQAIQPIINVLVYPMFNSKVSQALVKIGQPSAESLINLLNDVELQKCHHPLNWKQIQQQAILTLGKVGGDRAYETLVRLIRQNNENLHYVIGALAYIGPMATEDLIPLLDSSIPGIRRLTIEALGRIGNARAIEVLQKEFDKRFDFDIDITLKRISGDPDAANFGQFLNTL